jgi:hypothetical protein
MCVWQFEGVFKRWWWSSVCVCVWQFTDFFWTFRDLAFYVDWLCYFSLAGVLLMVAKTEYAYNYGEDYVRIFPFVLSPLFFLLPHPAYHFPTHTLTFIDIHSLASIIVRPSACKNDFFLLLFLVSPCNWPPPFNWNFIMMASIIKTCMQPKHMIHHKHTYNYTFVGSFLSDSASLSFSRIPSPFPFTHQVEFSYFVCTGLRSLQTITTIAAIFCLFWVYKIEWRFLQVCLCSFFPPWFHTCVRESHHFHSFFSSRRLVYTHACTNTNLFPLLRLPVAVESTIFERDRHLGQWTHSNFCDWMLHACHPWVRALLLLLRPLPRSPPSPFFAPSLPEIYLLLLPPQLTSVAAASRCGVKMIF